MSRSLKKLTVWNPDTDASVTVTDVGKYKPDNGSRRAKIKFLTRNLPDKFPPESDIKGWHLVGSFPSTGDDEREYRNGISVNKSTGESFGGVISKHSSHRDRIRLYLYADDIV